MDKLLVTPAEAAHLLSISRSRVYELLAAGRIASLTCGRSRRIRIEVLQQFIARLEKDAAA